MSAPDLTGTTEVAMHRRDVLKLGAIATATFTLGGVSRLGTGRAAAQSTGAPVVDRLVLTTVVDNIYDVFAKEGRLDTVTVQRTRLARGATLLAEHGLAYHLDSTRGSDRREILLDFSLTDRNLGNNYAVLKIDPARADALILSHGHLDHYGALPDLVRTLQGRMKPGLTVYAGGEDTFCHRFVVTPTATVDQGSLDRARWRRAGSRSFSPRDRKWWRGTRPPRGRSSASRTSRSLRQRHGSRRDRWAPRARPRTSGPSRWKPSPVTSCLTISRANTPPSTT